MPATRRPRKSTVEHRCFTWAAVVLLSSAFVAAGPVGVRPQQVAVRLVTDEAEAVLEILEKRSRREDIGEDDWRRLEQSEGYVRLKRRQESFGAQEFASRFRTFVMSSELLERRESLRHALDAWASVAIHDAAERALVYLPAGSRLHAKIYPVIKNTSNSFVFELDSDPAIFFYLDPERSAAEFQNTLAHELHHVGAAACDEPEGTDSLPEATRRVVSWLGAFAEGLAVLAAAGSPDVHPHAASPSEAWVVWERDVANFNRDLGRIEDFFQNILDGTLTEEEQRTNLFQFINTDDVPQGPFYTVGWKMASIVEKARGRDPVIAAACDPRVLLAAYNDVVQSEHQFTGSLASWSEGFLAAIGNDEP